jgi:hypothetical protein
MQEADMDDQRERRDDREQRDSEDVARPYRSQEQEAAKDHNEIGDTKPEDTREGQQQTG